MNDNHDDGVRIPAGKGTRFVGSILAAMPQSHRVYGEADGTVVIVPSRRAAVDGDGVDEDEVDA